jgi:type I restriction enzyme S subunit
MELMPDKWGVQPFGKSYAEPSRNGIYKSAEFQGRGTRIVNMGEMFGFEFISNQEMSRIALTPKEMSITDLRDGDLLFGRRSVVPAGAGKCSLVVDPSEPLTFESSIIRVRLKQTIAYPLFYYYFFYSSQGRNLMSNIIAGTNIKGIRGSELRELRIPSPSLTEQQAIASALSDIDALLDSLDSLIAKKRDLKQAAMQQLLTGQTRLPGFSGEWDVKRLGDLAQMGSGGTPLSSVASYYDGDIPWVSIADMTKGGKIIHSTDRNISAEGFSNSAVQMFPAGSILYAMYASLGECSIAGISLCTSQAILGIKPNEQLVGEFLYYLLISLKPTVKTLGQQGTQSNLNKAMVQGFKISLPVIAEQNAIVSILQTMDAELTALEQRRNKTTALKQGMMQELLTGRTRLV